VESLAKHRENLSYLPGFPLSNITFTSDIVKAVSGKSMIVMVVPSHVFRQVFKEINKVLCEDKSSANIQIISASKGIENDTLKTMIQIMEEICYPSLNVDLGVLSGPSFAREVAAGLPTAVTVAAKSHQAAISFQETFSSETFRVYTSSDVIGVELGGPLKNIVAIAAGISDGLGFGTNTRAGLITRGLAEISRMGVKMGASPLTFAGLAGLGDLVLTCTGDLSRNRQVGLMLGKGKSLQDILSEMNMVAEGVKTTKSAWQLAQKVGVEMPILEQVYEVLYHHKPCKKAVEDLLRRDLKEEV